MAGSSLRNWTAMRASRLACCCVGSCGSQCCSAWKRSTSRMAGPSSIASSLVILAWRRRCSQPGGRPRKPDADAWSTWTCTRCWKLKGAEIWRDLEPEAACDPPPAVAAPAGRKNSPMACRTPPLPSEATGPDCSIFWRVMTTVRVCRSPSRSRSSSMREPTGPRISGATSCGVMPFTSTLSTATKQSFSIIFPLRAAAPRGWKSTNLRYGVLGLRTAPIPAISGSAILRFCKTE
mmetsp:Transcript_51546/g.107712  ORF Transcript_51546/g.107712 Transcript_51546/m.107712 type:complete len:235 (+) Transcript_51546:590-1294(+)